MIRRRTLSGKWVERPDGPDNYEAMMLLGLSRKPADQIYGGTASEFDVARNRAHRQMRRRARRLNRRRP